MARVFDHKPTKVLIVGASGTGKTTFFLRYLTNVRAEYRFLFDQEGELQQRLGLPPALTPTDLGRQIRTGWILFDPVEMFPGRIVEAWEFFCDWTLWVAGRLDGRKILAVDELQKLVSTHSKGIGPAFAKVLETGRRFRLDFVGVAQQVNLLHNRIRTQLTELVCFHLPDRTARAWVADAGIEGIERLSAGEYVARNLRTGKVATGRVF